MRRRQIWAQQQSDGAAGVLPAGAAKPAAVDDRSPPPAAPQGITYRATERTTVTLPIAEVDPAAPDAVKFSDVSALPQKLAAMVAEIEQANPEGQVRINVSGKPQREKLSLKHG